MTMSLKIISVGAAATGSAMGMLFDVQKMDWQELLAFALIALVCLVFGTVGRLSAFDPSDEVFVFEKRRSMMLFGILYILSLMTAEFSGANIFGMMGIAGAYGLAGPLVVEPVVDWLIRILNALKPDPNK